MELVDFDGLPDGSSPSLFLIFSTTLR